MAHPRRRAHDRVRARLQHAQDGLGPRLRPGVELQRGGGGSIVFDGGAAPPLRPASHIRVRFVGLDRTHPILVSRDRRRRKGVPLATHKRNSVGWVRHAGVDAVGLERGEHVETIAGEDAPRGRAHVASTSSSSSRDVMTGVPMRSAWSRSALAPGLVSQRGSSSTCVQ